MGTFLLLLLIFFVVIPLCKALWRGWQLYSQFKTAQRRMNDAFNGGAGQPGHAYEQRRSTGMRKKINPEDGEYVAFEEIKGESTTTAASDSSFVAESQVEDAEWEDIR